MRKLFLLLLIISVLLFTPLSSQAYGAGKHYKLAKAYLHTLQSRPETTPKEWQRAIDYFTTIYQQKTASAEKALFMAALVSEEMFHLFGKPTILEEAVAHFDAFIEHFPTSSLADDALFHRGTIALNLQKKPRDASRIFARIIVLYPDGDMAASAEKSLKAIKAMQLSGTANGSTHIVDIRYGATSYYSRVVIESSKPIKYSSKILPGASPNSQRIYLDLDHAVIPQSLTRTIPINDGLLQQVRSGQNTPQTVRVVLDTLSFSDYKITALKAPNRLTIDVWGEGKGKERLTQTSCKLQPSLVQQLGIAAQRIILDPGHGGKDPGAMNRWGMKEKDITLNIARILAKRLRNTGLYQVYLTRNCDEYVGLEERTEMANRLNGDIFVSIHINAAESEKLSGIETYYLSLASSQDEMRAAAQENAAAKSTLNDLEGILMDLMMNSKINESARLAESIQGSMIQGLQKKYAPINLGVKKAPFIVLIGAQMPSVLAEISFLSNKKEAKMLKNRKYLEAVADNLSRGVDSYIRQLSARNLP